VEDESSVSEDEAVDEDNKTESSTTYADRDSDEGTFTPDRLELRGGRLGPASADMIDEEGRSWLLLEFTLNNGAGKTSIVVPNLSVKRPADDDGLLRDAGAVRGRRWWRLPLLLPVPVPEVFLLDGDAGLDDSEGVCRKEAVIGSLSNIQVWPPAGGVFG
jgi:hypothetical protein